MFAIQSYLICELLEVNLVTLAAAVEAEKKNHGTTHHGGKQDRAGGKNGLPAQELTFCGLIAA